MNLFSKYLVIVAFISGLIMLLSRVSPTEIQFVKLVVSFRGISRSFSNLQFKSNLKE